MRHCTGILFTGLVLSGLGALYAQAAWPLLIGLPFAAWRISYLSWLVRCPRCSRRMPYHECPAPDKPDGNPGIYYDCHSCRLTWDPQIFDEMAE
jgi:hypothetical protein